MKTWTIVLLLGLLLAAVAFASDGNNNNEASDNNGGDNNDNNDDDPNTSVDRDVTIQTSNNDISISSKSKSATSKTEWEFEVSTHGDDERLELEARFKTNSVGNGTISGNTTKLNVLFAGMIEYMDTAGAGFQKSELVKSIKFGQWGNIQCAQNAGNYNCTTTTISNAPSVIVEFLFGGNPFNANTQVVNPNEIKIAVSINNFPYTQTNTSVALSAYVRQKSSYIEKSGKGDSAVQVSGTGFFSWETTATATAADGSTSTVNVVQSILDSDRNDCANLIVFSFVAPQARGIFWDPFFGVGTASSAASAVVSYAVMALAVLLAMLL